MDRLTDNSDFIGPSVGRGSKKHKWQYKFISMKIFLLSNNLKKTVILTAMTNNALNDNQNFEPYMNTGFTQSNTLRNKNQYILRTRQQFIFSMQRFFFFFALCPWHFKLSLLKQGSFFTLRTMLPGLKLFISQMFKYFKGFTAYISANILVKYFFFFQIVFAMTRKAMK